MRAPTFLLTLAMLVGLASAPQPAQAGVIGMPFPPSKAEGRFVAWAKQDRFVAFDVVLTKDISYRDEETGKTVVKTKKGATRRFALYSSSEEDTVYTPIYRGDEPIEYDYKKLKQELKGVINKDEPLLINYYCDADGCFVDDLFVKAKQP